MKILNLPRAAGKTTRMIEWLQADEKRILIVMAEREVKRLEQQYPELSGRIMTWFSYNKGKANGMGAESIGIDELEMVLHGIFGFPVEIVSQSELLPIASLEEKFKP